MTNAGVEEPFTVLISTDKSPQGVDEPAPICPLSCTLNRVVDAISETKNAMDEVDPLPQTVKRAGAVEVPMARKFCVVSNARKFAESRVVAAE